MSFEQPNISHHESDGIVEKDGEFYITDHEVIAVLDEKEEKLRKHEMTVKEEVARLESQINEIIETITATEEMDSRLFEALHIVLKNSLIQIEKLQSSKPTLH